MSRSLLGLAAEGYLERSTPASTGPHRSPRFPRPSSSEPWLLPPDRSTRQRDLSEIDRLKQNNDVIRASCLGHGPESHTRRRSAAWH